MIFRALRETDTAERSSALDGSDSEDSMPPAIRTGAFTSLATVSKAFFHASIEILWERMASLVPFLAYVLPADKGEDGRLYPTLVRAPVLALCYLRRGDYDDESPALPRHSFDSEGLGTIYTLCCQYEVSGTQSSAGYDDARLAGLSCELYGPTANSFSKVRHLTARLGDALSLFVASNIFPVLTSFDLDLHNRSITEIENTRALTVGLKQASSVLTSLKLLKPTTPSIIEDISHISSLKKLHIFINHDPEELVLSRLAKLPLLESLRIVQELDPLDRRAATRFPVAFDSRPLLSGKGKFRQLKELCVKANGTAQYLIAAGLLPCGLKKVAMEVVPDALNTQMALIPLAGALYAHHNPLLERFDASIVGDKTFSRAYLQKIQEMRADDRFAVRPFVNALAKLRNLSHLLVWHIPFLAVDISLQLLEAVQSLPELTYLVIMPTAFTNGHTDALIEPTFDSLEDIVKHNRKLTSLQIEVDTRIIPLAPLKCVSDHPLCALALSTGRDGWKTLTTGSKFALAQYLDALFPHADLEIYEFPSKENEFWQFIQDSMTFYRKGRQQGAASQRG